MSSRRARKKQKKEAARRQREEAQAELARKQTRKQNRRKGGKKNQQGKNQVREFTEILGRSLDRAIAKDMPKLPVPNSMSVQEALNGSLSNFFVVGVIHPADMRPSKTVEGIRHHMSKYHVPLKAVFVSGDNTRPVLVYFSRKRLLAGQMDKHQQQHALIALLKNFRCIYAGARLIVPVKSVERQKGIKA
jgi:hypothetical protein